MDYKTLSDLDKSFKETFGKHDIKEIAFNVDFDYYNNIISEINENVTGKTEVELTPEYVAKHIETTALAFTNVKDARLERDKNFKYFGKKFSEQIIFGSPFHDPKTMYNIPLTRCVFKEVLTKNTVGSKLYFFAEYVSDHIDSEELCGAFVNLINAIIYTFDPIVVAKYIASLMVSSIGDTLKEKVFTSDRVRTWYETLISGENIVYLNDDDFVVTKASNVGIIFLHAMEYTPIEIVSNKDDYISVIKLGESRVYKHFQKNIVTPYLIDQLYDYMENDYGFEKENQIVTVSRKIRNDILTWEKWPDGIDKRPAKPESFEYIDITTFMEWLYVDSIYRLGDTEEIVSKFDENIERAQTALDGLKEDDESYESMKKHLESHKMRKTKYLTTKSLTAFLFQECTSNEKISDMVFDEDFVSLVLTKEPEHSNGMNDSQGCIATLYAKRDFNPIGSKPINPYYIHFGEGDISSDKAYNLAEMLSILIHPQMKSINAVACIKDMVTLDNTFETIKTNAFVEINTIMHTFNSQTSAFKLNYDAVVAEDLIDDESVKSALDNMIESFKDRNLENTEKCINEYLKIQEEYDCKKLHDDPTTEIGYSFYGLVRNILETINIIKDVSKRTLNVTSQMKYIIDNFDSEAVRQTSITSRYENKPQYVFWPITQQYEYEIVENAPLTPEEAERSNMVHLKPGDIEHKRYGSRYSMTNPDD